MLGCAHLPALRPALTLTLTLSILSLFLTACGGRQSGDASSPSCNGGGGGGCAKLTASAISPSSAVVNSGPVTLTISGSDFALGDHLRVTCGLAEEPTITSQSTSTSLVVTVPNSDLQTEGTFGCQVQDDTSGNATFPLLNFAVTTACPVQGNEAALASVSAQWIFLVGGENSGNPMARAGLFAPDGTGSAPPLTRTK
jgi:hypothetical protein